ncbi:MAG: hypothetical protein SGILL_006848 [Bacillariaceae sp.]
MNLCGGITNIAEQDLELPPDEEFNMPARSSRGSSRKEEMSHNHARPRSSSRGRGDRVLSSSAKPGVNNQPGRSSSALNPVSRDDYAKMRSRQRGGGGGGGMKSSSILMKKLESGFNVTWLNKDANGQSVNLSTNSDKTQLRIRIRSSRDENEIENDGAKSNNQSDLRLKVRHIARVGSDRTPEGERFIHPKSRNCFVIKMKQSVGEWARFKFVAESLAERDTVVLAIRSLMDQIKHQQTDDRRSESRSDRNESGRDNSTRDSSRRRMSRTITPEDEDSPDDEREGRLRASSRRVERISDNEASQSTALVSRRPTSSRKTGTDFRRSALTDRARVSLDDAVGCNPMNCQSQALAAVEEGELANFAADQLTGPWCTDDVCAAGLNGFADSMKGVFDPSQNQKQAEQYITDFLSDQKPVSAMLSVNDLFNVAPSKDRTGDKKKTKSIQNRARNADGKAVHLKNLQAQMTFNGTNTAKKISFQQTTNSFDDINRSGKLERNPDSRILLVAGQFDSSAYLDKNVNEAEDSDEERFYYDSDPDGCRERTLKRGPRRTMAERRNQLKQSSSVKREALNILSTSRFGLGRKWRRHGEEVVLDIIEATKNEKFTLMWHPTQTNSESDDLPTFVCVKMWVEAGVYLVDGTFLLPKLTWLPVHESNLHARILNTSGDSPGSLDLLDVCRVKECETIDRDLYPFAHVDRSFMIQTQSGKHLFEAQSKQERGRVVNGLKLVIARLASLLMLRDIRAVDEFFGGNNNVPGEAPVWARTEKNGDEFP